MKTQASDPRRTWSVLIVEDDAHLASLLAATLSSSFKVRVVTSAEQALSAFEGGGEFDLVLSDHSLPGMSGLDLLGDVRARRPATRRLMLTGETSRSVHERATVTLSSV